FKVPGCQWQTKTPNASIRGIVQLSKEIYKIRPGLYALISKKGLLEARGIIAETKENRAAAEVAEFSHYYYQGLLMTIGKLRSFDCWCPDQDKNRLCLNEKLGALRTLGEIPPFSYPGLVSRSATVDVIWFNGRNMPSDFFEVEQQGEMQNSLLKFNDLQDFSAQMVIVAGQVHRSAYEKKKKYSAFESIRNRLKFLSYESLDSQYEGIIASSGADVVL
ncbi:MAG: hypothetical protein ACREFR_12670, partial [Limisphaerales bacterium]